MTWCVGSTAASKMCIRQLSASVSRISDSSCIGPWRVSASNTDHYQLLINEIRELIQGLEGLSEGC